MAGYLTRLEHLNAVYQDETDRDTLRAADVELRELLAKQGVESLSENLRPKALSLFFRLRAKIYALSYIRSGFASAQYAKLHKMFEEELLAECPKEYTATVQTIAAMQKEMDAAHNFFASLERMGDLITSPEECAPALAEIEKKRGEIEVKKADFPFFYVSALERLTMLFKEVSELQITLSENRYGGDYNSIFQKMKDYTACNYYPKNLENPNINAKMQVICTPFQEEAELLISSYARCAKRRYVVVDAAALCDLSAGSFAYACQRLGKEGEDFAFFGMANRPESVEIMLPFLAELLKTAKNILLHDSSGDRKLYKKLAASDLTSGARFGAQVAFTYLSLPNFQDVAEELRKEGYFTRSDDEEFVKRNCYAMGFVGFNALHHGERSEWRAVAEAKSRKNLALFNTYLAEVPNQALLIDSGWDYAFKMSQAVSRGREPFDYDYDAVREYVSENLHAILDGNFSFIEKCGLLVKYCVLLGEDDSVWVELGRSEDGRKKQEQRLQNATRTLARFMNTERIPDVFVIEEAKWEHKSAGGFCSNGGAEIKYRADCVQNTAWVMDAVCHETYHSFQNTAINGAWRDWYLSELRVTKRRIEEWTYNDANYYSIAMNEKAYHVQIFEADTRIFAAEAIDGAAARWSEINFVR